MKKIVVSGVLAISIVLALVIFAPKVSAFACCSGGGGGMQIHSSGYEDSFVTVAPGTTITWTNYDSSSAHTVTGGSWDSGTINPNGQYSITFNQYGIYTFTSTLDPTWVLTVRVLEELEEP